ncbi:alpha/beta hydrolase [Thermodesulfobacteriota bacterium]
MARSAQAESGNFQMRYIIMFNSLKIHIISLARIGPLRNSNNILVVFIGAVTLLLFPGCLNSQFYQPNQTRYETPAQYNLRYEEVFFKSKDGTRLHGWFIPAVGNAVGTVIHFHGNFGNLTYYFKQISWLPLKKYNVFTFDYRGYGQSEGRPSRLGIYEDSVAAIEYLMSKPAIDHRNVFVFGQSLGGVNAIVAIAKNDFSEIRAIAIEGAFYSYRAEARDMMIATVRKKIGNIPCLPLQIWPISFLSATNAYSPGEFIDQVAPIPVLLIHCTQDSLVSYHHSEKLYAKAQEPKHLWVIRGCNHLQVFTDKQSENSYRQRLLQFFNNYRQNMK